MRGGGALTMIPPYNEFLKLIIQEGCFWKTKLIMIPPYNEFLKPYIQQFQQQENCLCRVQETLSLTREEVAWVARNIKYTTYSPEELSEYVVLHGQLPKELRTLYEKENAINRD
jgi:hypothetical protein